MIFNIFYIAFLIQVIIAIPIPVIITRIHTAPAVIVTDSSTTLQTTVTLPPDQVLISNGQTIYITRTDQAAGIPTTTTNIVNDTPAEPTETNQPIEAATTTQAAAQTMAQTTQAETIAAPQTTQAETTQAVTTQAEATQAEATQAEATQAEATHAETTQAQAIAATQATQAETTQAEATQAETTHAETTQAETTQAETTQAETTHAETTQAETTQAETTQAETTHAETTQAETTQAETTQAETTTSSTSSTSTSTSTGSISAPNYIVYSPYSDDGSCKSSDTIKSDIDLIKSKGISKLRIYGTDCGNFDTILPYSLSKGITINQGVYITSAGVDSIDDSINDIISYGEANGWSVFEFITIGNEAINENFCSVSDLISKISSVKSKLSAAGYSGKITTSEPPISFINHPSLCTSSGIDFVGINPHSYFNTELTASQAGEYIVQQQKQVAEACNGMSVAITETGYPSQGNTNGNNVPSAENQKQAIASIIEATGGDVTILTTYNDFWKNPGPYGIEQYFGTIDLYN